MSSLPIDPSAIRPEDRSEHRATLDLPHEPARDRVREAIERSGFSIVVEFSPSAIINEHLDEDRDPYHVFGACSPSIADIALRTTWEVGGLLPCNIVVKQAQPELQRVYQVNIFSLSRLTGIVSDDTQWDDLATEVEALSEEVFTALNRE